MSKRTFVDFESDEDSDAGQPPVYYGPDLIGWLGNRKDFNYEARNPVTGQLQKRCECNTFCNHGVWHDILEFAPSATKSKQKRDAFDTAYVELENAFKCKDGMAWEAAYVVLWANSAKACQRRRDYITENRNKFREPCRLMLEKIRSDMHAKGGCKKCKYNGPSLEIDHIKRDGKTKQLSDLGYWASNGGPEAMWKEYTTKCQCLCRCCHRLEPTSNTGQRKTSMAQVEAMPAGKWNGTREEIAQYHAKRSAMINTPKYLFVDELKRTAGCCVKCKKKVTVGYGASTLTEADPRSFDTNHMDERTKYRRQLNRSGGIAEICDDLTIRLDEPHKPSGGLTGRQLIIDEWKLIEVICCNCHTEHSNTRLSETAGSSSAATVE